MPVLCDFESRSRADLKRIGGRNYWLDPSTTAICAVLYDTDTGAVGLWQPGDPCPVTPDTVLGAHNARGFDRFAALKYWGLDIPIDTAELARRAGLPGALDALAMRWLGRGKDKEGSRFTIGLSTCRRPTGKTAPRAPGRAVITPEEWSRLSAAVKRERGTLPEITADDTARVISYCANDVEVLADAWPRLEGWQDIPWENDVSRVDRIVNDRGIAFDSQLAAELVRVCDEIGERALAEAAREIGDGMNASRLRDLVMSPEQFAEFTGLENAKAETIDEVLENASPGTARYDAAPDRYWCAYARRAVASIARGKLLAGLGHVSPDGRLRDSLLYYGGHPGRWSHKGMQLGNMPRPAKRFEEWRDADVCRAADEILAGGTCDAETVDVLLRASLTGDGGPLAVCDFSGVEARASAWCAGDHKALEVFADPTRSPYKEAAATIFGCGTDISKGDPRYTAGKVSELACGYQGGVGALEKMARAYGLDFAAAGVDPQSVVDGWRKLHWPIVRLWRRLEDALLTAARGNEVRVTWEGGAYTFTPSDDGQDVAVFLPSGRPVVYNEVHVSPGEYSRPRITHRGTKPYRDDLYGGKILQNLIEGLCRDLMADSLVRAEDAGLEPVLHVHDEIVTQRGTLDDLREIMLVLPEWAEGFPIGAAGHEGFRYRK